MKARANWTLFRTGIVRRSQEFDGLPEPVDSRRLSSPGPNPDRILMLGGGIIVGTGVMSHDLGIGGHLGRALTAITERGAQVEVVPVPGVSISDIDSYLLERPLPSFDAVVIAVGINDAIIGTSPERWGAMLRHLLEVALAELGPAAVIHLLEIADPSKSPLFRPRLARRVARRVGSLNAISATVIAEHPRATLLRFDFDGAHQQASLYDSRTYRRWAEQLAPAIADRLTST